MQQRELSRRGSRSGSFLFFYGKTGPNSQQKTPRVTPLGVFCFSQCFLPSPTDRVPRSDSLFAERISEVRSQPASSPPTPPKSPLQLSASLRNTPLSVNNPGFSLDPFSAVQAIVDQFSVGNCHLRCFHKYNHGEGTEIAVVGGIKNACRSSTTFANGGGVSVSVPFFRKAIHCVDFDGSRAKPAVSASGGAVGIGV